MKKLIFYSLPFVLSGCVLQTKYDALMDQKDEAHTEAAACAEALRVSDAENTQLREASEVLAKDTASLGKLIRKLGSELVQRQKELRALENLYEQTIDSKGKISKSYEAQQRYLSNIRSDLEMTRVKNENLARNLAQRERRVLELERLISEQQAKAEALQEKASQALESLSSTDFSVKIINGEVYVSLSEKLLFKSGKSNINEEGADALEQLALALQMQQNFEIVVEGHTDSDPVTKTSSYMKDNWDLSVIRATSVARILVENGVDPKIIHPGGRGEYAPKESNETREGKQQNRRIEIILKPTLKEFYQVLGSTNL
ncbi:MAG: OmpA family protein [Cytophagales bacterium]|nr:OmpA family protein [Cytophagales bacterium]